MIRRPPRSTLSSSSAASDVYKRQAVFAGRLDEGSQTPAQGGCSRGGRLQDQAGDRARADRGGLCGWSAARCGGDGCGLWLQHRPAHRRERTRICLLYTSDAADEEDSVDLGGRRIIKKKKKKKKKA